MILCVVLRKINLHKTYVSIIQFSQLVLFPFTVHNLLETDVKEERRKIKRLATKTQYGQGSCYYGSELILERLSTDEITKWQTQNSSSESGKGQLISKCPYEKSVSSKIPTKIFLRFLPWKFTTSRLTQKESLCSVCKKIDSVLY